MFTLATVAGCVHLGILRHFSPYPGLEWGRSCDAGCNTLPFLFRLRRAAGPRGCLLIEIHRKSSVAIRASRRECFVFFRRVTIRSGGRRWGRARRHPVRYRAAARGGHRGRGTVERRQRHPRSWPQAGLGLSLVDRLSTRHGRSRRETGGFGTVAFGLPTSTPSPSKALCRSRQHPIHTRRQVHLALQAQSIATCSKWPP